MAEVYSWDAEGNTLMHCEHCNAWCRVFDAGPVRVGYFIKRVRVETWPDGHVVEEAKFIPVTKMVKGCKACQEEYWEALKEAPPGRDAFLKTQRKPGNRAAEKAAEEARALARAAELEVARLKEALWALKDEP